MKSNNRFFLFASIRFGAIFDRILANGDDELLYVWIRFRLKDKTANKAASMLILILNFIIFKSFSSLLAGLNVI